MDNKWSLDGMQSKNFWSKTRSILKSLSNNREKGLASNYSPETDSVCKHGPVVQFCLPASQNTYGNKMTLDLTT